MIAGDVQVEVACVFDLISPPGWAELDQPPRSAVGLQPAVDLVRQALERAVPEPEGPPPDATPVELDVWLAGADEERQTRGQRRRDLWARAAVDGSPRWAISRERARKFTDEAEAQRVAADVAGTVEAG